MPCSLLTIVPLVILTYDICFRYPDWSQDYIKKVQDMVLRRYVIYLGTHKNLTIK